GQVIFGEISPDCMRVRGSASDEGEALDKDNWRSGGEAADVLERYKRLHSIVFGEAMDRLAA
ncbi:MAG: phosphoribosylaminoimidazolesuccinocarboxamide synthase, partial [Alphaproteobacteria bacterium]|nr:phosphoribosylaminoimidazolesuccinocarboxamide synthase [Alphaproteobacteria bacterium]